MRTVTNRESKFGPTLLLGLASALLLFLVFGCKSGSQFGIVGSVSVADDAVARPSMLVRYDGNVFVAWASGTATAEVFGAASGFPLYGPVSVSAGKAVVHVKEPKLVWEGDVAAALPPEAAVLFRPGEIAVWGLVFEPPLEP